MDKKTTKEIREEIINAAAKRFGQYGFNKTTMAEIAGDCGMSAGNIYRFFENKNDIAAECAVHFFYSCEVELKRVVHRSDLNVIDKLQEFFVVMFNMVYDLCVNHSRVFELVNYISKERKDLILSFQSTKIELLCKILSEGNSTGEFNLHNILRTAEEIMLSTIAFHALPVLFLYLTFNNASKEMKTQEVRNIINLLINGIKKKQ